MDKLVSHELLVPHADNDGVGLPHLLPAVKRHLAKNGVNGFTITPAKGTWTDANGQEYPDEDMHHIAADVPDTPHMDDLFSRLAEAIADEGRQQAVYHRKLPVQVSIHPPQKHPDIDLSDPEAGMLPSGPPGNEFEYTSGIFR